MVSRSIAVVAFVCIWSSALSAGPIAGFSQTNLVSNVPNLAAQTDPALVNPWGVAFSGTSPFWVSDNGGNQATLYNSAGTKQALVVTIPSGAPTGQIFNGTTAFNSDLFIFSSESGAIDGWRGALGTNAEVLFDNGSTNAVYKGLAIASVGINTYLYAADFHNNKIAVFPGTGAPALAGNFTDPNLPAGFAPFNVQNVNGQLYVTYAKRDAAGHDDVPGAGFGYVDVFGLDGTFVKRLASGGVLNSPWGVAQAPAGFGSLSGDIFIGNFGDGAINVFDPILGTLIGTLANLGGKPLLNDGLWALTFGNGGNGGLKTSLYITAGLNGEEDGLLARIDAVPEPATTALLGAGLALSALLHRRMRRL